MFALAVVQGGAATSALSQGEASTGAIIVFALELAALYWAGYFATSRLYGAGLRSGGAVTFLFYLLVFPGVALHESAHYAACVLTGTRVQRFTPFSPQKTADGRLMLGYVLHAQRSAPVSAIIGLAPVVLNPIGIVVATALLTPLTYAQAAGGFDLDLLRAGLLESGFVSGEPLKALLWAYLIFSFALGSVPSREDLRSVPAALALLGGAVLALSLLEQGPGAEILAALTTLCARASALYALPAVVALTCAALVAAGLYLPRRRPQAP